MVLDNYGDMDAVLKEEGVAESKLELFLYFQTCKESGLLSLSQSQPFDKTRQLMKKLRENLRSIYFEPSDFFAYHRKFG